MRSEAVVEFLSGLGIRYSYFAFTQLGRLRQMAGCGFVRTPISSEELLALRGKSPFNRLLLLEHYLANRR